MKPFRFWPLLLLLLVPIAFGLYRLRFDVEVLNLLPQDLPAVQGLKIYQDHFANARQLMLTVRAAQAGDAENTARLLAEALRKSTNLVAGVSWQPPWLEHPDQIAELLGYLWLNQPREVLAELTNKLSPQNLASTLAATREQLATSLSPDEIARAGYDPYGLTRLPESVAGAAPGFGGGDEMFASPDGTFRVIFVEASRELPTYRECTEWLEDVKAVVRDALSANAAQQSGVKVGFTGRPAFVAEISAGMRHDMTNSVGGTAIIIAILFWLAHKRLKPMLWLLVLLALILGSTLALGGLLFGKIYVVSMGFAAILLGLAVDYAVVHYQEALAHPDLSIPQIRSAIAPSIFWAAVTTISAFLVLNFGGLPGLAQLGSLVGLGVALSALLMIFAFLPPLFPGRWTPKPAAQTTSPSSPRAEPSRLRLAFATVATISLLVFCAAVLVFGFPGLDPTANALRPRNSPAYDAMDQIKNSLNQNREPLWLIVSGRDEAEVGKRLEQVQPVLDVGVSNGVLSRALLPTALWPKPESQNAAREFLRVMVSERGLLHEAAATNGFAPSSLGLTDGILNTWQRALETSGVFWPTNETSRHIFDDVVARSSTNFYVLGLLTPAGKSGSSDIAGLEQLEAKLPHDQVLLSGWELLGHSILGRVKANMWKLLGPMLFLVSLSLWLAFHRWPEVLLSVTVLVISALCLLSIMRLAHWSWNLLNLMALPLILGTGVDYSIFIQLGLRRYHGDLQLTHRAVGRALLLCGGTAIAGFGSLAWSSNAGMASLGQVCAIGIAGNMLLSIFLLPLWWSKLAGPGHPGKIATRREAATNKRHEGPSAPPTTPSSLYCAGLWKIGLSLVRILPLRLTQSLLCALAGLYWRLASHRREIVVENLLPVAGSRAEAERQARKLFRQFALKLVDLWRYEAGLPIDDLFGSYSGWEHFLEAQRQNRGVLLVTPHLGNWEFGGPALRKRGMTLQVITLAEPGKNFTQLRQASRARWQIETFVIGEDPFAIVEVIRRLEAGANVALLLDRPPLGKGIEVELFEKPFLATLAAAELARASGCVVLPVYLPRVGDQYEAHMLPPMPYDRAGLRDPVERRAFIQRLVSVFEPLIRNYMDQWYHFVPIWPSGKK